MFLIYAVRKLIYDEYISVSEKRPTDGYELLLS